MNNEELGWGAGCIVVVLAFLASTMAVLAGWAAEGVAISYMWEWFVVPLSSAIPTISILHGLGISVFVGLVTIPNGTVLNLMKEIVDLNERSEAERSWAAFKSLLFSIARPLGFLLFGFLIHLFM